MNTKQLTYPTIEEQKQFWIDKEAQSFTNRKIGEPWDKTEAQSNNATRETREAQRLAEAIREAIRLEDETIIREALAEYDSSHLNQSASDDSKPEELSRTESLTNWYDHARNDFDRGDLRDEGRNPDGSGESYSERNV